MGNDPTTTIPSASNGNMGLILILALLAPLLTLVAMHVFYRSLRPRAGVIHKAVAGCLGALAFLSITLLMVQVGPLPVAILTMLVALGFVGYAFPWVRQQVRAKVAGFRRQPPMPKQPPDHATLH